MKIGILQWESKVLADTDLPISTFGEDDKGRLYVADHGKGEIYRIVEGQRTK